ncbi:unnamed protein product [Medioppia subpectinata]|uniref:C2H2-type domain-containing protein n=1 Tax=Medioppia subpectinata TaxID=1979941 RepID=A0A7R9KNQ3_9ACAR|nr:unnamed protein product [Medioppia subpectinata]CAG2106926.1 unnamed protein product [Medioppia subpectinata]
MKPKISAKTSELKTKTLRNELKKLKSILNAKQKLLNTLRQKCKRFAIQCNCHQNQHKRNRLLDFCHRLDGLSAQDITDGERQLISTDGTIKWDQFLADNSTAAVERVDNRTYRCVECDKSYHYLSQLRRHLIRHSEDVRRHQCPKCHKTFKWREGLKKHVMYRHDNLRPEKTVRCAAPADECDKWFRHVFQMNQHYRQRHSRPLRYRCEYTDCAVDCDGFVTKHELDRHIRLEHMNARPLHRCEECHKEFTCESNLAKHVNVKHLRLESYECPECDQRFTTKPKLSQHEFSAHNRSKTYRCEWPACEFTTVHHKSIARHKLIHTNERPFVCDWCPLDADGRPSGEPCGASFKQINTLKAHVMKHTGEKPFECPAPDCALRFQSKRSANNHFTRKHCDNDKTTPGTDVAVKQAID